MDKSALIDIRGFGKRYGRTVAVRDVTLRVERGQLYGLIGADGAGKSSPVSYTHLDVYKRQAFFMKAVRVRQPCSAICR